MYWLFWIKWNGKVAAWIDSKTDSRTEIIIKVKDDTITKRWIWITKFEFIYVLLPFLLWYNKMEDPKTRR
jgi:hypothetical protein